MNLWFPGEVITIGQYYQSIYVQSVLWPPSKIRSKSLKVSPIFAKWHYDVNYNHPSSLSLIIVTCTSRSLFVRTFCCARGRRKRQVFVFVSFSSVYIKFIKSNQMVVLDSANSCGYLKKQYSDSVISTNWCALECCHLRVSASILWQSRHYWRLSLSPGSGSLCDRQSTYLPETWMRQKPDI